MVIDALAPDDVLCAVVYVLRGLIDASTTSIITSRVSPWQAVETNVGGRLMRKQEQLAGTDLGLA